MSFIQNVLFIFYCLKFVEIIIVNIYQIYIFKREFLIIIIVYNYVNEDKKGQERK